MLKIKSKNNKKSAKDRKLALNFEEESDQMQFIHIPRLPKHVSSQSRPRTRRRQHHLQRRANIPFQESPSREYCQYQVVYSTDEDTDVDHKEDFYEKPHQGVHKEELHQQGHQEVYEEPHQDHLEGHKEEASTLTPIESIERTRISIVQSPDNQPGYIRIPVVISDAGEDVHQPQFTSRLGVIVKTFVPICNFDWRKVSNNIKDKIIQELEDIFDWGDNPNARKNILKHGGMLHRGWRMESKKAYFLGKPYDEALQNLPLRVQLQEWKAACEHWMKEETILHSQKSAQNRSSRPLQTHVLGRTSIDAMQAKYQPTMGKRWIELPFMKQLTVRSDLMATVGGFILHTRNYMVV